MSPRTAWLSSTPFSVGFSPAGAGEVAEADIAGLTEAPTGVDAPSEGESQTGEGGPWLQMIRDLFPFKINSCLIQNGSVHFRAYKTDKSVDVYLSELNGSVDNLGNIRNETTPLVSTVQATGVMMDQAKLDQQGAKPLAPELEKISRISCAVSSAIV